MDQKEPLPQEAEEEPTAEVAGLVRRVLAFIVDGVVLFIPLFLLGCLFREVAFGLGPYGRLIGFAIVISYFGFLNAHIMKGQTIGKRLTKIVVVDGHHNYLGVGKSFVRAFILTVIILVSNWVRPEFQNTNLSFVPVIVVFGVVLSTLYGIIFNRPTRQGLHDMVVGSYVVNVSPETEQRLAKTPRMHRMIMGGLMGLGIAFGLSGFINSSADSPRLEIFAGKEGAEIQAFSSGDETNFSILEEGQAADLQRLESVLLENDEYFTVDVNHVTRILMEDASQLRDLRIELWARTSCEANRDYCQALIMETAEIAFEQLDFIKELDGMRITVVNRFDLGLSDDSYSQSIDWRMADWKVELAK